MSIQLYPDNALRLGGSRSWLRVSGGGAFTPASLANLDLWLKADALVASDDDLISTWPDSGAAGHDAIAAGAARPTFKTNIKNSLPVVRFNGTSNFMDAPITAGAAKTVFVVGIKRTAPTADFNAVICIAGSARIISNSTQNSGNFTYYYNEATGFGPILGAVTTDWFLLSLNYSSAASVVPTYNGTVKTAIDPADGYSISTTLTLSATEDHSGLADYDLAEVLIYTRALTAGEQASVETYLNVKWDLYP